MWVAAGIAGNERYLERPMADDALPKATEHFESIERKVPPIAPSSLAPGASSSAFDTVSYGSFLVERVAFLSGDFIVSKKSLVQGVE